MTADTPSFRLGTRGSRLALAQAELAAAAIEASTGEKCRIVIFKTSGDRITRPLAEFGGKGLFAKELEEALLAGDIDFAVHSLKDLPADLPAGLTLAAVMERHSPYDTMVQAGEGGSYRRFGTCSVRRAAQIQRAVSGAEILPLRGNVDTRLKKLDEGLFDAVLLSVAGLTRLGLAGRIGTILQGKKWLPALAQGAIGLEARTHDSRTLSVLSGVNHPPSMLRVVVERAFQAGLNGSCHSPIAGLAEVIDDRLEFIGEVIAPDGSDQVGGGFERTLTGDASADCRAAAAQAFALGAMLKPKAASWL